MKKLISIAMMCILQGCANSPSDLRSNSDSSRIFITSIKGSLNSAAKCFVRNLDEVMPNLDVIVRELNQNGVLEIQQRTYGELIILHDIQETEGMIKINSYIYPRDLTPFYTKNQIKKVVKLCQ